MKAKLHLLISILLITSLGFGQFQKSVQVNNKHHHDLNIEPLSGTTDYIVAGNLFDNAMQNEELFVKKVDDQGVAIWYNIYTAAGLQHLRGFDVITLNNEIYVTGSVDVNNTRRVVILKIDANSGILLDARYYDPVISNFHSRGLAIEYTNSDANGDGTPDPGFIVGGFFSDCYNLDPNCVNNNIGFVMRVDLALNILWTEEIDSIVGGSPVDYDFVNSITETSDGFFITGSNTGMLGGSFQQAVLAYKIDFQGTFQWDESYIFGNSRDVSVDAYYDLASNKIFMLTNYSVSHYFGVTVINNAGGIVPAQSWYITDPDLNRYGFTIMESYTSGNNLIITGYDRDETWLDGSGTSKYGETNLFIYEFDKATGAQVGQSYQYLVPNVEPAGDDFNFWFWQMPLIYYPDISFLKDFPGSNGDYYHVGYRRTMVPTNFVESELFRTTTNKINVCDYLQLNFAPTALTTNSAPALSGSIPNSVTPFTITITAVGYTQEMCVRTLSNSDHDFEEIELYPNPSSDYVFLSTNTAKEYSIVDTLGRTVMAGIWNPNEGVYIGNLKAGLYFVLVYEENNHLGTFKLVKE